MVWEDGLIVVNLKENKMELSRTEKKMAKVSSPSWIVSLEKVMTMLSMSHLKRRKLEVPRIHLVSQLFQILRLDQFNIHTVQLMTCFKTLLNQVHILNLPRRKRIAGFKSLKKQIKR